MLQVEKEYKCLIVSHDCESVKWGRIYWWGWRNFSLGLLWGKTYIKLWIVCWCIYCDIGVASKFEWFIYVQYSEVGYIDEVGQKWNICWCMYHITVLKKAYNMYIMLLKNILKLVKEWRQPWLFHSEKCRTELYIIVNSVQDCNHLFIELFIKKTFIVLESWIKIFSTFKSSFVWVFFFVG